MPRILFPCRKYFAAQVSERHAMSSCNCVLLLFGVVVCLRRGAVRLTGRVGTRVPVRVLTKKTVDTERDVVDGLGDAIGASSLSTPMQSSLDVYIVYALHLSSLNSYPI